MSSFGRLTIALTALALASCADTESSKSNQLTDLNRDWLVTTDEAYAWSSVRHENLPILTGSQEWLNYMAFLEQTLSEYGVVDGTRNSWEFERWSTSEDNSRWSLSSDGANVRIASYGAYSGSTGAEGITAELVYWDHDNPPESIEGKIVVIPTKKHPDPPYSDNYLINYTFNDYEYATDGDTLPAPFEVVSPSESFTFDIWWQLAQGLDRIPRDGNAAGAVIVYDMAYERTIILGD